MQVKKTNFSNDVLVSYHLGKLPLLKALAIKWSSCVDPDLKQRLDEIQALCSDLRPHPWTSTKLWQCLAARPLVFTSLILLVAFATTEAVGVTRLIKKTFTIVIRQEDCQIQLQIPLTDDTKVYLDNKLVDDQDALAQQVLRVSPGSHEIRVLQAGRVVMQQAITARSGEELLLEDTVGEAVNPTAGVRVTYRGQGSFNNAGREIRQLDQPSGDTFLLIGSGGYGQSGRVQIVDLGDDSITTIKDCPSGIPSIAVSPDGEIVAFSVWNTNELIILKPGGPLILSAVLPHTARIAMSRDGMFLVSVTENGLVSTWSCLNGQKLAEWKEDTVFHCVTISPDGGCIIAGGGHWQEWGHHDDYGLVKVWDRQGNVMHSFRGHDSTVLGVAVSPDSRLLATAGVDKSIRLWDLKSGKSVRTIWAHNNVIESVAFSRDGNLLASGSWDTSVKLWNPSRGQLVATLNRHTSHVLSVLFSTTGDTLFSSSAAGTVNVWEIVPD